MITTQTPLRMSLVGGGTDMPAFYKQHPGSVVSFAINKYVYVSVNKKFDGRIRVSYSQTENVETVDEIKHDLVRETLKLFNLKSGLEITSVSDIPGSGTGLGSSSAFTVGLINALGKSHSPSTLAERAFVVEAENCYHPVGKQDMYASAHGGVNHYVFGRNFVRVDPIPISEKWQREFESHSLLLWTGISRDANEILKTQSKGFSEGNKTGVGQQLALLADNFYYEILSGISMERTGEFLDEAWKVKKFLVSSISSLKVDSWYETAIASGAFGGKLLGAGGGGFLFFIAPPYLHEQIQARTGLKKVEFKIEKEGSRIIYET